MNAKKWLAGFQAQDQSLTLLLGAVLLMVFFIHPLAEGGPLAKILLGTSASVVLVSGILVVSGQRLLTLLGGMLGGLTLLADLAQLVSPGPILSALRNVLFFLFLGLLNSVILHRVIREGPVNRQRIEGSILVYLILGLMWSQAYQLLETLRPGSFAIPAPIPGAEGLGLKLTYFSFVTLTTVGYGDITPLIPFARSLALLEALTGQLFPVILIARLVAMEVESRRGNLVAR